jgi:tripartite ATP-independent transporter DctM subunit
MSSTLIIIVCVVAILVFMFLGAPLVIAMGMAGILGLFLDGGVAGLSVLQTTIFGSLAKFTLVAVPLFMLMGEIIFRSGIGNDLFHVLNRILRRVPGGLAIATIIACAIFGAMCGVSIAAVASIGVVALPEMLKRGYDPKLAAGAVCAPGALAMLIPPSLLFILYGEMAHESVAKLFTAGILPGLLMALLMCVYVFLVSIIQSKSKGASASVIDIGEPVTLREAVGFIKKLWAPFLLIVVVLGSIYTGIATPTESAAIGCVGAYFITIIYRRMTWSIFRETLISSARITCTIMFVFVGAIVFTQVLSLLRVPDVFSEYIVSLGASPWMTMILIQLALILMGMFVDGASMVLITTPIFLPTMVAMHWDPIWFGVLMVTNINIAVITPPVGLNLYTLASLTKDVDIETILKGTLPYVVVEFIALLILIAFPQISLWLPSMMK